jgi:hypothetical protein
MNQCEYINLILDEKPKLRYGPELLERTRKIEVTMDVQAAIYAIKNRRFFHCGYPDFNNSNLCINKEPDRLFLSGTNLFCADLAGAHLELANLSTCFLFLAKLNQAHLQGVNFIDTILRRAELEGADLEKADLKRANLTESNLKGANLKGANLQEANFEKANLKGANLQEANLKDAYLKGADLREIRNLSIDLLIEQLSNAETLYNAKLDEELEKPLRTKYLALFQLRVSSIVELLVTERNNYSDVSPGFVGIPPSFKKP